MLYWAETFFVIALTAAVSGFGMVVMVSAAALARTLFSMFLFVALMFLVGALFLLSLALIA